MNIIEEKGMCSTRLILRFAVGELRGGDKGGDGGGGRGRYRGGGRGGCREERAGGRERARRDVGW